MSERDWLEVASRYVGIPYLDGGRDRAGLDCWGLVRLFYAEQLGLELPSYADAYSSAEELLETAAAVRRGLARWRPASSPAPGDVALLWVRRPALPSHVGIVLPERRMLHTRRSSGAVIERLDSPFWGRRVVGYYRHEALVEDGWLLVAWPSPFSTARRELALPRGVTIGEALARAGFVVGPGGRIRVWIGDEQIEPRWWDRMRPRPGTVVSALSVPGDPISIGATLAAIGSALASSLPVVGPAITGAILTAAPGAALTGAAAIGLGAATFVAGAAIAIGASFALSMLATSLAGGPEQPQAKGAVGPGQSPAAAGVGNRADPFGPVPVGYGTVKIYPPLAAPPFTEIIGEDRYWRLLLCVGAGRYQITDIEVGGVPIDAIPGAQAEIVEGGVPKPYEGEILDTEPVDDSPVSYWRLDDETGSGTAANLVAGGPELTVVGTVTFKRPTLFGHPSRGGSSAELDGVASYLHTLTPPAIDLAGDWTIELWVRPDEAAAASPMTLIALGDTSSGIQIGRDANKRAEIVAPGVTGSPAKGVGLANGVSSHVVLRRRKGKVQLWQRGNPGLALDWTPSAPSSRLSIGARWNGSSYERFFDGRVQEVAIYDVALSDDEIRWHYDAGSIAAASAPPATRGPRIRLYRDTALEVPVNARFDPEPASAGSGPIYGNWTTRSIPGEVDELHVEVFFPGGIGRINEDGKSKGYEVLLDFEYRLEGAGDDAWEKAAASAELASLTETGHWRVLTSSNATEAVPGIRVAGFVQAPMLLGWRWPVPRGRYEVRHRRVELEGAGNRPGGDDSAATFASYELLAFRGVALDRAPVRAQGVSLIGLLLPVKETGSTVGQISCIARRMLPIYDPDDPEADPVTGFTPERVTDNGAWAALDWLRSGYANARPVPDAKIDLAAFKSFATRAQPTNLYVDFRTNIEDGFNLIAGSSFGALAFNGKWTVVEDRAGLVPVTLLTPRNTRGLTGVVRFPDLPHALRVRYLDASKGFQERELLVYADGYSEDGSVAGTVAATKFDTVEIRGLTDAELVRRHFRIRLAMARLRREEWRTEIELDHIRIARGDVVRLQHWSALLGQTAGRVIKRNEAGGFVSSVELDETVIFDGAISYGALWRLADGTLVRADTTNPAAPSNVVTFTAPVAAATAPAVGDLITVGERNEETVVALVREVIRRPGFTAQVVLIPYEEGVFSAPDGPVAFSPIVARPVSPPELAAPAAPVILSIASDERYLADTDAGLQARLRILVRPRAGSAGDPAFMQVRARKLPAGEAPGSWLFSGWEERFPAEIFLGPVETGELYEVQARASTRNGVSSPWSSPVVHRVVGESSLPPDVPAAQLEGDALAWDYPSRDVVRDLAGFLLRWRLGVGGGAWERARPLHPGVWAASPFPLVGRLPTDRVVTVLIKAIDRGGRESANAARVVFVRTGDPGNVVLEVDHRALGWPGTKTDCAVVSGDLAADLTASDGTQPLFPSDPGVPLFPTDPSVAIFGAVSKACSYVAAFTPGAESVGHRLTIELEVTPAHAKVELDYRYRGPGLLFPEDPYAPLFPSSGPLWDPEWSEWVPWPGVLERPERRPYEWRLSIADLMGDRAKVTAFAIESDVEDLVEILRDVPISAAGSRLPLTKAFAEIRHVSLTLQYVAGQSARTVRQVDSEPFGPLVEVLDASGAPTAGTIDAEVRGVPLVS